MKTKNTLTLAAALAAALIAQSSVAQPGMSPASSAKGYVPAGQAQVPASDRSPGVSTQTRGDVKAKTRADAKNKKLTPAGEAASGSGDATSTSGMKPSRAQVKSDTKAAVKDGSIPPAGEGSVVSPKH